MCWTAEGNVNLDTVIIVAVVSISFIVAAVLCRPCPRCRHSILPHAALAIVALIPTPLQINNAIVVHCRGFTDDLVQSYSDQVAAPHAVAATDANFAIIGCVSFTGIAR